MITYKIITGNDTIDESIQIFYDFAKHIQEDKADTAYLSKVALSGSYNDLSYKPSIPIIPTKLSYFENDIDYVTTSEINDINAVISESLNSLYDKINENEEVVTHSLINIYKDVNKLKTNVDYIIEHGVEIDPETPVTPSDGKKHYIYYGNMDIELSDDSQLDSLSSKSNTTGSFTISNVDCNSKYFYIVCENSKTLKKVISENNETLTDYFELKETYFTLAIDNEDVTFKIYEFYSQIPLDAKITITIS